MIRTLVRQFAILSLIVFFNIRSRPINSPITHRPGFTRRGLARRQGSLATDDRNRPICLEFRILSSPFLKLFKVADVTVRS